MAPTSGVEYGVQKSSACSRSLTDTDSEDDDAPTAKPPEKRVDPSDTMTTKCRKVYEGACRQLRIAPRQNFLRQLGRQTINLRNSALTRRELNAVCAALLGYGTLALLDLSGNSLNNRGVGYVCQLLARNDNIKQLNLSECGVSVEGLQLLTEVLPTVHTLTSLNIAGNRFTDEAGNMLADLINASQDVRILDLSHNELRERGGVMVGQALANNEVLDSVDLSWNHLRGRGAECVALALMSNTTLTQLNLSWNGFGFEGCCALGQALHSNTTLKDLDLTCNRIHPPALYELLKGLLCNRTLECLRIGRNPIPAGYTSAILAKIRDARGLALCMLDLSGVVVDKMFEVVLQEIKDSRRFECLYERSLAVHKYKWDDMTGDNATGVLNIDPIRILFFLKKNLRMIDLFRQIDVNNSAKISRDEIRQALLKENFPVSSSAMDSIMAYLDIDNDGEVDLLELLNAERRFKRETIEERQEWEAKERLAIETGQADGMPGDLGGVGGRFTRTFRPDLTDLKGMSKEIRQGSESAREDTLKLPSIGSRPGGVTERPTSGTRRGLLSPTPTASSS